MTVQAKICGINSSEAMAAATGGGATFVGLVFYPPSPRYVTSDRAAVLAAPVPPEIVRTGLYVDATDDVFETTVAAAGITLLQLHGSESPDRVRDLKSKFDLPVMKAIKIAGPEDLAAAEPYFDIADRLLFDAKPPKEMTDALPGGNALSFDWELIAGRDWPLPWMLSGGLNAGNLAEAVRISGAVAVDVSSGVEDRPGVKNPAKIREFLETAERL